MAAVALVVALIVRPSIAPRGFRWLDIALLAYLALMLFQLVPLTPHLRLAFSPAIRLVDLRLRFDAPLDPAADTPHPLTVNADGTIQAAAIAIAVLLTFWCARTLLARGGIRTCARTIAALGTLLAGFGIAQHVTAPHTFYWVQEFKSTQPFGPFMNRSDFAMWLIMALPMTAGYLLARLQSRQQRGGSLLSTDAFDDTASFLTIALGLMAAALMVGLSRSGIVGAAAGALTLWILSERRMHHENRVWLLAGIVVLAIVAIAFANTSAVAVRLRESMTNAANGRLAIWRATLPIIRDYWRAGTGAGAYERAMMVYQPVPHETYFNHAHNEYLQLATEGGLALMIPAAVALAAGIGCIRRQLSGDRTPIYWVRAGAASGLAAAAVQSIWETGLRRPANTLLFAVLAAIAMHAAVTGETTSADR